MSVNSEGRTSEEIRREIDSTRGRLSDDVNALTDSVKPGNVARRQASRLSDRVGRMRDSVMGTADDVKGSVMGTADGVKETGQGAMSSVGDTASSAKHTAVRRTEGNPLAAGLIALGAGWLVGSMLPASQAEQRLASAAQEQAQPLVEEAKEVAQQVADDLKEPAREAVQNVKETAATSAQTVRDEGRSAAGDVQASATEAKDAVKDRSSGP